MTTEDKLRIVDTQRFISNPEPLSRLFGLDRGKAIDRYYIDSFLKSESDKIKKDISVSTTLEVAENTYSKQFFSQKDGATCRHDILRFDKGQDLTDIRTIPENEYDVFICTQVYNFIYDVKAAINGSYHLLKKGGYLLATVAGNISQVSRYDMDRWGHFWGFTYEGIRRQVAEVFGEENVKVYPFGNSLAATAFIQGLAQEDLPDISLLDKIDEDYAIVIGVVARKV